MGAKLVSGRLPGWQKLGVEIQLGAMVDVATASLSRTRRHRPAESACKVWSAVSPSVGQDLAIRPQSSTGRPGPRSDLSIPGHPNVFVGDMAAVEGVPGVAQGVPPRGRNIASTTRPNWPAPTRRSVSHSSFDKIDGRFRGFRQPPS